MSLEFNKIAASFILALMVFMVAGIVSEGFFDVPKLAQDAYPIAGAVVEAAAPAEPAYVKPAPIPVDMLAKADPATGAEIAQKCMVCHTFEKGEAAKVGPNLWGIINNKRAHMVGFNYSDAMQKLGGTWTVQEIAAFIAGPQDYLPGTRMSFAGLPKAGDRANVLAFLNTKADTQVDLAKAGAQ